MKRLFLILFLLPLTSMAQEKAVTMWFSKELNGRVKCFKEYSYDSKALADSTEKDEFYTLSIVQFNSDGEYTDWSNYDENGNLGWHLLNLFDGNGNVIESRSYSDGVLEGKDVFEYDDAGNEIKFFSWEYVGFLHDTTFYWIESSYDEKGRIILSNYYSDEDTASKYKSKTWQYDDKGNEILSCMYDSEGNIRYKTIHSYDDSGRPHEVISTYADTGLISVDKYEYDSSGNYIITKGEYQEGKDLIMKIIEKYNSDGLYLKEIHHGSKDDLIGTISYTYNEIGKLLKEETVDYDGTVYSNDYYYEKDNLMRLQCFRSDELIREWLYEYDEKGNWIRELKNDFLFSKRSLTIRQFEYYE